MNEQNETPQPTVVNATGSGTPTEAQTPAPVVVNINTAGVPVPTVSTETPATTEAPQTEKGKRGRPKGSKNKPKTIAPPRMPSKKKGKVGRPPLSKTQKALGGKLTPEMRKLVKQMVAVKVKKVLAKIVKVAQ